MFISVWRIRSILIGTESTDPVKNVGSGSYLDMFFDVEKNNYFFNGNVLPNLNILAYDA